MALYGIQFSEKIYGRIDMSKEIQVVIASGIHLYPFRTEKLNLTAPMVLRNSGRVGSCRIIRNRARREAAGSVSPRSIFFPWLPLLGHLDLLLDKTFFLFGPAKIYV